MMEDACLFLRVRHPYGCLPANAGSAKEERMGLIDKTEEEGDQPPCIPCAWAHSVMKWPVSQRPRPNNEPIQPGELSLSKPG